MNTTNTKKGFTLIELMVAVSIFAMVMTLATGATLSIISQNRHARAMQAVMMNLNYALETMARNIRYGSGYNLMPDGSLSFISKMSDGEPTAYRLGDPDLGENDEVIYLEVNGLATELTSPQEVIIDDFSFDITGDTRKFISIFIGGSAKIDGGNTVPFTLQTAVSSRSVEL
ncbi:MAG: prepilin-type N-terminal cleavage/methylation domain-containing protein [Candidatus Paceibacterota bacterium]|jgi:prepilin-type N-terminal cleavage/methylation domain-containing protein